MDTYVTVTVYSKDKTTATEAIDAAFERMEEVISTASTFDNTSEAYKLNQNGYLNNPSHTMRELIMDSKDYGELTGGSFDITVQPLLDLWKEGLWKEKETVQKARIAEVLPLVGWDKIAVESNKIYFKTDGMKITLGGIAKGYVVDAALDVLRNRGVEYALINAGGDMGTIGGKPDGEPWNISLVNPDDTSQSIATFELSDKAIATSGNYERYFDPEKKAHHILDPRTGFSPSGCISVSIIADNCTRADVLATSVFVMGPDDGMEFVESLHDVECLIIDSNRHISHSSGLSPYLKGER
ncbi:MAG: FAD:protein FMN transferase [Dehalococcoidia bacterium]|nr:FAD:protein FMN transferase [Dehalococcoidia bacterium]